MAQNEPLKSLIAREIDPGYDIETDDQIRGTSLQPVFCKVLDDNCGLIDYIRSYNFTCYHALGTLSMLPRDHNGVVDPNLKV